MLRFIGRSLLSGVATSLIDNFLLDKVEPKPGCVVYCDLALGYAEHSGIYVGDGEIVHLSGDGEIEQVGAREFLARLDGFNPAISIYVSCDENAFPQGGRRIAQRALAQVGRWRDYNVIMDNCHQFSSGCVTGDFENSDNFLRLLKHRCQKHMDASQWRVWDR